MAGIIEWDENGYPTAESLQRLRKALMAENQTALEPKDCKQNIAAFYAALKERARLEKRVRELEEENRCLKAMLDCYVAVLEAAGITANDANIIGKHLKEMGVKHEEI